MQHMVIHTMTIANPTLYALTPGRNAGSFVLERGVHGC